MTALSFERVRFDMPAVENPGMGGVACRLGELRGCGCGCAWCAAAGVPLQIEHFHPRSRGGSDGVANLTLCCEACKRKKDVFLKSKPDWRPLAAAAAVNTRHWRSVDRLAQTGLPIEFSGGGRTRPNRARPRLPESHSPDAVCG